MNVVCTLTAMPNDTWRCRHSSSALGDVEKSGTSRDEVLERMQRELQYRMELCPCTGESVGTIELTVNEEVRRG